MNNLKHILLTLGLLVFSLHSLAINKAHIQVSAQGNIEVLPDYIQLLITVEKTGADKATTKADVDSITQEVIDAAHALDIDDEFIEASQLSIYPQYMWEKNQRRLKGETVQRSIAIKLYALDKYTALADAIASVDITRMQQQGFGFDNLQQHQNIALIQALEKATEKAELIANTMGRKLGAAYQISENSSHISPVFRNQALMARAADNIEASAAALEIRPQTVNTTVNIIFLLK